MDSVCRLCGSEEGIHMNIFEPDTEYVKKIHKVLPITINEHDPFPKTMCHKCSFKVNEFFEFRSKCIAAQETFKRKMPWLKGKTPDIDSTMYYPPMVEVPVNSVFSNEKTMSTPKSHLIFIDESDPFVISDDDSPPHKESCVTNSFEENQSNDKIILKKKKTEIKKKPKPRSVWLSRRKRKRHRELKITEVFTTTLEDHQSNTSNIENDPLQASTITNIDTHGSFVTDSSQSGQRIKAVAGRDLPNDITLPSCILITQIPQVGSVYTCEKCGRTFLNPMPASQHVCDFEIATVEEDKVKEENITKGETSSSVDYYKCTECGSCFSRRSQLVYHKRKHIRPEYSDSDENSDKVFNRKKKHRSKQKSKSKTTNEGNSSVHNYDIPVHEIPRHSLLSSDTD